MKELSGFATQLDSIKADTKQLNTKVNEAEKNNYVHSIAQLKYVQKNMQICKTQMDSMSEWTHHVISLENALQNNDIETAALLIHTLHDSYSLLENLPNKEERKETLDTYLDKIHSIVSPKLEESLQTMRSSDLLLYKQIYIHMNKEEIFIEKYANRCKDKIIGIWNESLKTPEKSEVITVFWGYFYNYMCVLEESKNTLFGTNNDYVTSCIYKTSFVFLSPSFCTHLSTLNVTDITTGLDTTTHYIEILTSTIHNRGYRYDCIESIYKMWSAFISTSYIQKEMEIFNDLLLPIETHPVFHEIGTVQGVQDICVYTSHYCEFFNKLKEVLLSIYDRCSVFGDGAAFGQLVAIINSITETIQSKYESVLTLLLQYSRIDTDKINSDSFNWDIFRSSLNLNSVLDQISMYLKQYSNTITDAMRQRSATLLNAIQNTGKTINTINTTNTNNNNTNNTTTTNNNNTINTTNNTTTSDVIPATDATPSTEEVEEEDIDIQKCLYSCICKEPKTRELLLPLLDSLSIPSSTLLLKSINSMKYLQGRSMAFICKLYSTPITKVFNTIPQMQIWLDVDNSVNSHSLPSDYLMPLGEHILKAVEQIEIAYNSILNIGDVTNKKITVDISMEWRDTFEKYVQLENKKLEKLFDCTISYPNKTIIDTPVSEEEDPNLIIFINNHLYLYMYIILTSYLDNLCHIPRIRCGGSKQLSVDVSYLANILTAFGCSKPVLLTELISICNYNDTEISDAYGRLSPSDVSITAVLIRKISKLRGILGC
ncbi:hypothetical protein WA158_005367 [Blastocystis sp. Blastoise]